MLGHVSAATTLDIYTHATSDMQHAAARKIDCGIGKAELPDEPAPQANVPAIVEFQPYMGKVRKPGNFFLPRFRTIPSPAKASFSTVW